MADGEGFDPRPASDFTHKSSFLKAQVIRLNAFDIDYFQGCLPLATEKKMGDRTVFLFILWRPIRGRPLSDARAAYALQESNSKIDINEFWAKTKEES
ncbi:MAG: hypothetical protein ABSA75_12505 [Candidatus Bathyarchaeia archaeon]